MKKIILSILCLILMTSIAGCSQNNVKQIPAIDQSKLTDREKIVGSGQLCEDKKINQCVANVCPKSSVICNDKSALNIFLSFDEGSVQDNVKDYKKAIQQLVSSNEINKSDYRCFNFYLVEDGDIELKAFVDGKDRENGNLVFKDFYTHYSENEIDNIYYNCANNVT